MSATNGAAEFAGMAYEVGTCEVKPDEAVLAAIRRLFGQPPDQDSWAAAGLRPSERTFRRRFGSFAAAVAAALSAEIPSTT